MKLHIFLFCIIILYNYIQTSKAQDDQTEDTETTTVESENEGEGEDESETINIAPDYSTLNLNYTPYPNGGVLVQYTQNGLNYIVRTAEEAALKLMTTFPIPDIVQDDFTMKNVTVKKFDKPKLLTKFVNQTGMEIKMIMPKLEILVDYTVSVGFVSNTDKAGLHVKNLVVNMLLRIEEGRHGLPAIKIPICEGKVKRVRIVTFDQSWRGTLLNSLRGVVESVVTATLGSIICFAVRNTTGLIETIFLDWNATAATTGPTIDQTVICGTDIKKEQQLKGGGAFSSMLAEVEGLNIDMNTNGSAYFDDDEVVIGLKGDFSYKGKKTGLIPKPLVLPHTERMICFAVKELVLNSFGVIAQDQKYFEYSESLEVSELPTEVRVPLKVVCPKCRLQMYASTKDPFRVEFLESGVKAFISGFLHISGTGLFGIKVNVVEATFEIESLVNLVIDKEQTIKGSVDMGKTDIEILNFGVGGLVRSPFNALLRKLIPKFIWPMIKRKIDKIINDKGFKLPVTCGLSFEKTEIRYTDGAVIVSTDFLYDLNGFIDRFIVWQQQQMGLNVTTAVEQLTTPSSGNNGEQAMSPTPFSGNNGEQAVSPSITESPIIIQTLTYEG